jgi:hypothetical protein
MTMSEHDDDAPTIEGQASSDGKSLAALVGDTSLEQKSRASLDKFKRDKERAASTAFNGARTVPALAEADDGRREESLLAAQRLRERRQAEIRAANNKTEPEWKGYHYVECNFCHGPGIWIYQNVEGVLGPKDWEASYKPVGAYWSPQELPHCQCCEQDGLPTKLRMFFATAGQVGSEENPQRRIGIQCNPRFVRRISKKDFEDLVGPRKK